MMTYLVVGVVPDGTEELLGGPFAFEDSAAAYVDELIEVGEASNYDEVHVDIAA